MNPSKRHAELVSASHREPFLVLLREPFLVLLRGQILKQVQDDGKNAFSISPQVGNRQKAVFDDNDGRLNRQIDLFDAVRGVASRLKDGDMNSRGLSSPRYYNVRI